MCAQPTARVTQWCAQHRCPRVVVNARAECAHERVERHLRGRRIVDLVETPTSLVFADGHTLPVVCPDCASVFVLTPAQGEALLNRVSSLYLVGVAFVTLDHACGLALALAPNPRIHWDDSSQPPFAVLLVHPDSARRLTCPKEHWNGL